MELRKTGCKTERREKDKESGREKVVEGEPKKRKTEDRERE